MYIELKPGGNLKPPIIVCIGSLIIRHFSPSGNCGFPDFRLVSARIIRIPWQANRRNDGESTWILFQTSFNFYQQFSSNLKQQGYRCDFLPHLCFFCRLTKYYSSVIWSNRSNESICAQRGVVIRALKAVFVIIINFLLYIHHRLMWSI